MEEAQADFIKRVQALPVGPLSATHWHIERLRPLATDFGFTLVPRPAEGSDEVVDEVWLAT